MKPVKFFYLIESLSMILNFVQFLTGLAVTKWGMGTSILYHIGIEV